MNKEINRALGKAKVHLMQKPNSTFVTTVLFSLHVHISEHIPTAATDGLNLYINEDFFMKLREEERIGLLFHETFHVVYNHMDRGKDLNQQKYNQAGDHVINLMALDAGFTLPKGGLHDKKYKNMSTLEVYSKLPDPPKNQDPNSPCTNGADGSAEGGSSPASPGNPDGDIIYDTPGSDTSEKQIDLAGILQRAVTAAKMQGDDPGSIPGEVQVMLDELFNPKLPWQTLLQNYMTEFAKNDYTWTRPNRRYMPEFYLPSARSEAVGQLAIAVDTSGSVTDQEFTAFLSEIQYIQESLMPEKITVIDFDTEIKAEHSLGAEDNVLDIKFSGRGGTNIHPVMKWAEKQKPLVMIVFSDMEFTYPKKDPGCPVLWVVVNNKRARDFKFGVSIHLELD